MRRTYTTNFTRRFTVFAFVLSLCLPSQIIHAQNTASISVQVNKPGAEISPTMFGVFFEDINFGADGGLYPERVKNRSFEFPEPMMSWKQLDRGDKKGQLYIF